MATLIKTISEYRNLRNALFKAGRSVGFVPTVILTLTTRWVPYMKFLTKGHSSLFRLARQECDIVVASIFVNPAQFAPTEDLDAYPKTLTQDLEKLGEENVDYLFLPTVKEMYPMGIPLNVTEQKGTFVNVEGVLGSLTRRQVVADGRLHPAPFLQVQQCAVVKSMVRDLHFPVKVIVGDTVREDDGLAMSSRNRFLSPSDRARAPLLYAALQAGQTEFTNGRVSRREILDAVRKVLRFDGEMDVQYLSLVEPFGLAEVEEVGEGAVLSGAVRVGNTRIIDNVFVGMTANKL